MLTPTVFHALIATRRLTSAAISSGRNPAATSAYASAGTCVWASSVTDSVKASAARSRAVKNGVSRPPQVRVTGIAAGLHALLRLPPGQHEDALVARAARHGLAVEGLSAYRLGGGNGGPGNDGGPGEDSDRVGLDSGPALVVGYATPPGHAYSTAVARLCAVLSADG